MPSRRELIQLTSEELREFLRRENTLIIVSNGNDGFPHPMPMHFIVDDEDNLWVITYRKSQKVKNFERDGRASLLVETGEEYSELRGVAIYASATIVDELDEVKRIMVRVAQKRTVNNVEHDQALQEAVEITAAKRVAIKFTPIRYISWDHAKLDGEY